MCLSIPLNMKAVYDILAPVVKSAERLEDACLQGLGLVWVDGLLMFRTWTADSVCCQDLSLQGMLGPRPSA